MSERLISMLQDEGLLHGFSSNPSDPRLLVNGTVSASHFVGEASGTTNLDPTHITFHSTSIVQDASHFPAPVNGTINLTPNTKYLLFGTIRLPDNVKINAGISTGIIGNNAPTDNIIGNVDAPLVSYTNDGTTAIGHVYFCTIQNLDTGSNASALDINVSASNTVVTQESRMLSAGKNAVNIRSCANAKLANTFCQGKNGVEIYPGAGSLLFDNSAFVTTHTTGSAVFVTSGSNVGLFTFQNSSVIGFTGSQVGIKIFNSGSITKATFESIVNFGPQLFNSGWDQTIPGYAIRDCSIPDSISGGASSLNTSPSTIGTTLNTWTDISNGANIYNLNPGSERFILTSQTNGEIKYIGTKFRKFYVIGAASVSLPVGVSTTVSFGIWKNNQLISSSVADVNAVLGRNTAVATVPFLTDGTINDVYKIRLRNNDGSANLSFQSVGIAVVGLGA